MCQIVISCVNRRSQQIGRCGISQEFHSILEFDNAAVLFRSVSGVMLELPFEMTLAQTNFVHQATNRTFTAGLVNHIHRHGDMGIGGLVMTSQIRQQIPFHQLYPSLYVLLPA